MQGQGGEVYLLASGWVDQEGFRKAVWKKKRGRGGTGLFMGHHGCYQVEVGNGIMGVDVLEKVLDSKENYVHCYSYD